MLSSDTELVLRAVTGDRASIRALVDRLTPVVQARVGRALYRWRGSARGRDLRQELLDLTQEVFAELFARQGRVLRSWDPAKGLSLENFAGLVATRRALSALRSRRQSPFTEEPTAAEDLDTRDTRPGAEATVASRELFTEILKRLTEELSPQGMQLFTLLFLEQRSVEEVQAEAGLSRDAVYAWRSRLRKRVTAIRDGILEGAAGGPGDPNQGDRDAR